MSCSNPSCSCCRRSYLDGLLDGLDLGFNRGIKAGYVAGYVDATLHRPPPPIYRDAIDTTLARYLPEEPNVLLPPPGRRRKTCMCAVVCTCGNR